MLGCVTVVLDQCGVQVAGLWESFGFVVAKGGIYWKVCQLVSLRIAELSSDFGH